MKNIKVCALLCAVALSANTALPVMAAENAENTQATEAMTEVEETQPVEEQNDLSTGDETESKNTEGQKEESEQQGKEEQQDAQNHQEQISESEVVQDGAKEKETQEMPTEDGEQMTEQEEPGIPENGWYTDENNNTYYYENGIMIQNQIKDIADEDGTIYGYYFDWSGILNQNPYNRYQGSFKYGDTYVGGYIRSESNGHLYKNAWYVNGNDKEYYGENYICPREGTIKIGEDLYYFDQNGYLVTNTQVVIGDQLYQADENGVLSLVDTGKDAHWVLANGVWYYYESGVPVKNVFRDIAGECYYFNESGKMQTGFFYCSIDGKNYLASSKGAIVVKTKDWYYAENQKWYYFDEAGNPISDKIEKISGKEYYFNYEGEMQTGSFSYYDSSLGRQVGVYADASGAICRKKGWIYEHDNWYYVNESGENIRSMFYTINEKEYYFNSSGVMESGAFVIWKGLGESVYYFADTSGVIDRKPGWKKQGNQKFYAQEDGILVTNELKEIDGNLYYFNNQGVMRTGYICMSDDERYIASSSGEIIRNAWAQDGVSWYFTGKDGKIVTSQWIGDFYFGETGAMAVGVVETDKGVYLFDDNGRKVQKVGITKGWQLVDGTWYYYDESGEPHDGWLNNQYYIENGKMLTEEVVPSVDGEGESYVGIDGCIRNGWIYDRYEDWYYSENGRLVKDDWKLIGSNWYYFNDFYMNRDSLKEVDGKLHQFDGNGAWKGEVKSSGWLKSTDGYWYWINQDGTVNTDQKKKIGNLNFYFWSTGEMIENSTLYDNKTGTYYWINGNGNLDTSNGWKRDSDGGWYYQENGKLVTGKKTVNGREYYFYPRMRGTEIICENGKQYVYYDENGAKTILTNGWYYLQNYGDYNWYYFINGTPADGWVNGYYFPYNGRMANGIVSDYFDNQYMFDENGHLIKNQWIFRWGDWYYASASGRLYTGERTIGGVKYLFGDDGVWVQ